MEDVMNLFRVVTVVAACLSVSVPGLADDRKKSDPPTSGSAGKGEKVEKPDFAKLLVGKWERTDGPYAGTTMAFDKNGTHVTTTVTKFNGKPIVMPGTWKLDGETLTQRVKDRGYVTDTKVTIIELTEEAFRFKNMGGQEAVYKRVSDTKK
jgi:uncharacterized protein (TIGR03066 family)